MKTNDICTMDVTDLFDFDTSRSENAMKMVKYKLQDALGNIRFYPEPSSTEHLEKMIQKFKENIEVLQSGVGSDITKFFYAIKNYIKEDGVPKTNVAKYHVMKILTLIEEKKYHEARRILYAYGFKSYIVILVWNEILNEDALKVQMKELILVHKEMIQDIEGEIKKTRIRALYNQASNE